MSKRAAIVDLSVTLAGVTAIGVGAYLTYPPAAFIAVGSLLLGLVLVSKIRRRKPE